MNYSDSENLKNKIYFYLQKISNRNPDIETLVYDIDDFNSDVTRERNSLNDYILGLELSAGGGGGEYGIKLNYY